MIAELPQFLAQPKHPFVPKALLRASVAVDPPGEPFECGLALLPVGIAAPNDLIFAGYLGHGRDPFLQPGGLSDHVCEEFHHGGIARFVLGVNLGSLSDQRIDDVEVALSRCQ